MANVAIFIGRFQPVHAGHVHVAKRALERHSKLIIALGSANRTGRPKNPYSNFQRMTMWNMALQQEGVNVDRDVRFIQLDDMPYSDNEWVSQVRHRVNEAIVNWPVLKENASIALTGHMKDESSYYLRFFPEWEDDLIPQGYDKYASTHFREFFYKIFTETPDRQLTPDMFYGSEGTRGLPVSNPIFEPEFMDCLRRCAAEWDWNRNYDPKNYDVNVITVDAVIIQNGHVLTVTRKHNPGKGLKALPGGHLNPGEKLVDAMLRETAEETKIDLSKRALRANILRNEVFDDPSRSDRARVITQAYLIKLPDEDKLIKVKGADDAARAFWTPLSEVRAEEWFEDHAFIVEKMVAGL